MTCSLEYGVTSGSRHRYHRKYYREGGWKEIGKRLGKGREKGGREGRGERVIEKEEKREVSLDYSTA